MDLLKLIGDLRTYRAQVVEAIAAMEELVRHRGLAAGGRKRRATKSPAMKAVKRLAKTAAKREAKLNAKREAKLKWKRGGGKAPMISRLRPILVKPKPRRAARKGNSR